MSTSDKTPLHLSFERSALVPPKDEAPHVLVIGAGIIGLSVAWTLLDSGFKVTVLAAQYATFDKDRLTSQIAGALWEYPPAVCGRHGDSASLARPKRWSMVSYHVYKHMASTKDLSEYYGVRMRETVFFFNEVVKNNKDLLRKMRDTEQSGVAGFRHDSSVTNDIGFSIDKNLWPDAYQLLSPVIDTDLSLIQITSLVRDKGAALVTRTLDGKLIDQELDLLREFNADVMVNASGLSSFFLVGDDKVQALEGAVLRFRRDEGSPFAGLSKALIVSAMDHHEVKSDFVFIVPRNDRITVVGGFAALVNSDVANKRDATKEARDTAKKELDIAKELAAAMKLDATMKLDAAEKKMDAAEKKLEVAERLVAAKVKLDDEKLDDVGRDAAKRELDADAVNELDGNVAEMATAVSGFLGKELDHTKYTDRSYPLAHGFRPARKGGVRLERESDSSRIIHCYGHGGSGWSLSFGCALEVKSLVEDTIDEMGPLSTTTSNATSASTSTDALYPTSEGRELEV